MVMLRGNKSTTMAKCCFAGATATALRNANKTADSISSSSGLALFPPSSCVNADCSTETMRMKTHLQYECSKTHSPQTHSPQTHSPQTHSPRHAASESCRYHDVINKGTSTTSYQYQSATMQGKGAAACFICTVTQRWGVFCQWNSVYSSGIYYSIPALTKGFFQAQPVSITQL